MSEAKPFALNPRPRFPALTWREPVWLWLPLAYVLAAGWPFVALEGGGGMALALAIGVAITAALALVTSIGFREGARPLRARRDIVMLFLIYGAVSAVFAPTIVGYVSGAIGTAGFTASMASSLWPLALIVGLPVALFAGLAFSLVLFVKPPARDPDMAVTETPPPKDALLEP